MMFPYDHLSPSSINRYLQCPLKFLYEKEGKEKQWDDRYAVTGGYIHHNIECAYTGEPVDTMQLDGEMEKRFTESLLGWRRIVMRHGTCVRKDRNSSAEERQ